MNATEYNRGLDDLLGALWKQCYRYESANLFHFAASVRRTIADVEGKRIR